MAGMDGNRTHPGRLSSAPQTVLKTARLASGSVHERMLPFGCKPRLSTIVRCRPQRSADLAVILAVIGRGKLRWRTSGGWSAGQPQAANWGVKRPPALSE